VRLKARVGNKEYDLILNVEGDSVAVAIEGRQYQIEVLEPEAGTYLIFHDKHVQECHVSPSHHSPDKFEVNLRGRGCSVVIIDPKRLRSTQNSDRQHHGAAAILAPMPGKVVRVLVRAGAEVEKGVGVVVVEAMKMQNELKSPQAGVVVSVNVVPGDTVNAGDVLAVVE
jgi:biotin carboxyl carrier protein